MPKPAEQSEESQTCTARNREDPRAVPPAIGKKNSGPDDRKACRAQPQCGLPVTAENAVERLQLACAHRVRLDRWRDFRRATSDRDEPAQRRARMQQQSDGTNEVSLQRTESGDEIGFLGLGD